MEQQLADRSEHAAADTSRGEIHAEAVAAEAAQVVEELLIEEISIDGMCGVY